MLFESEAQVQETEGKMKGRQRQRERETETQREGWEGGGQDSCSSRARCRYKNFSKVSSTNELTIYKSYRADL